MYLKTSEITEKYKVSRSTVSNLIAEMIASKRYPASAIIGDTCRRVDADAIQDYMENRSFLRHPNMRKYVKPYKK
jgi:hypothetical protein